MEIEQNAGPQVPSQRLAISIVVLVLLLVGGVLFWTSDFRQDWREGAARDAEARYRIVYGQTAYGDPARCVAAQQVAAEWLKLHDEDQYGIWHMLAASGC